MRRRGLLSSSERLVYTLTAESRSPVEISAGLQAVILQSLQNKSTYYSGHIKKLSEAGWTRGILIAEDRCNCVNWHQVLLWIIQSKRAEDKHVLAVVRRALPYVDHHYSDMETLSRAAARNGKNSILKLLRRNMQINAMPLDTVRCMVSAAFGGALRTLVMLKRWSSLASYSPLAADFKDMYTSAASNGEILAMKLIARWWRRAMGPCLAGRFERQQWAFHYAALEKSAQNAHKMSWSRRRKTLLFLAPKVAVTAIDKVLRNRDESTSAVTAIDKVLRNRDESTSAEPDEIRIRSLLYAIRAKLMANA